MSKTTGTHPELTRKGTGKAFVRVKDEIECNIYDPPIGIADLLGGFSQSQPPNVRKRSNTQRFLKQPGTMPRRVLTRIRQIAQRDVPIMMGFDIIHHSFDYFIMNAVFHGSSIVIITIRLEACLTVFAQL